MGTEQLSRGVLFLMGVLISSTLILENKFWGVPLSWETSTGEYLFTGVLFYGDTGFWVTEKEYSFMPLFAIGHMNLYYVDQWLPKKRLLFVAPIYDFYTRLQCCHSFFSSKSLVHCAKEIAALILPRNYYLLVIYF